MFVCLCIGLLAADLRPTIFTIRNTSHKFGPMLFLELMELLQYRASHVKVAFGRSVRLRKGFSVSVFVVFDGEFEGRSTL